MVFLRPPLFLAVTLSATSVKCKCTGTIMYRWMTFWHVWIVTYVETEAPVKDDCNLILKAKHLLKLCIFTMCKLTTKFVWNLSLFIFSIISDFLWLVFDHYQGNHSYATWEMLWPWHFSCTRVDIVKPAATRHIVWMIFQMLAHQQLKYIINNIKNKYRKY
jgi:hypothetical protein